MLNTKRHLWLVGIVLLWMAVHIVSVELSSRFAAGPPGPPHSFIAVAFWLEGVGHLAISGVAITAIRNRVGWWKKPTYGDDGLLSIDNSSALEGSSYEVQPVRWGEIGWIAGELTVYIVVWAWILRPWFNR